MPSWPIAPTSSRSTASIRDTARNVVINGMLGDQPLPLAGARASG